jgi:hypothetical protein
MMQVRNSFSTACWNTFGFAFHQRPHLMIQMTVAPKKKLIHQPRHLPAAKPVPETHNRVRSNILVNSYCDQPRNTHRKNGFIRFGAR